MSTQQKNIYNKIDWALFALYFIITCIGILAIYSVEFRAGDLQPFAMSKSFMKQGMWLVISLIVGFVILLLDSKMFTTISFLSYAVGIFLLLLVLVIGSTSKGSGSWIELGFFRFQPGEVAKIFTALALSKYLSSQDIDFRNNQKHRLTAIGLVVIPAILIIASKETGLALVYFSFFLAMYREGLPRIYLVLGFSILLLTLLTLLVPKITLLYLFSALLIIFMIVVRKELMRSRELLIVTVGVYLITIIFSQVLVPFTFKHIVQAHQVDRIYTMLGRDVPQEYIKTKADGAKVKTGISEYNVKQSIIAIGSGGFAGKGFLNGTQTQMNFVPVKKTDFIFCSIAEQFGFIGSFILIILFVLMLLRIIHIAETQRSLFTRIYAYSLAGVLFFHLFINIGMTIGLVPVIGIPLPMVSYGGTSLLTFSMLIAILIRLDMDKHTVLR